MTRKSRISPSLPVLLAILIAPVAFIAEAGEPASDPAAVARGAQQWTAHCGRCHNLRAPDEKQDYEWDVSVNHMRVISNIPGDTARDIRAFLAASN